MRVVIWNRKNNEIQACIEWEHGRLTYKRFRVILSFMFSLAADSAGFSNLVATFDNSPQTIEMRTLHDYLYYSKIYACLIVGGTIVRRMTICD